MAIRLAAPRLGYRPALDGLRGIAVVLVMLDHAEIRTFPGAGNVGVTVFFVLSGFLITTLLLEEHAATGRVDLMAFLWRRACRLIPALAILVVAVSILMMLMGRAQEIAGDVGPTLLYFMNWTKVAGDDPGLLSHAWSLSIEGQFYVIWPLALLGLLAVLRARLIAMAFVVGFVAVAIAIWRVVLWNPEALDRVYWSTDTRADALLLGCALGMVMAIRPFGVPSWAMGAAGVALVATMLFSTVASFATAGLAIVAVAAGVLVIGAMNEGLGARLLAWRPLVAVGIISYGLYLFHRPVMRLGTSLGVGGELGPALIMAAISVVAACLSWRYVEKPFMEYVRRTTHGRQSPRQQMRHPAVGRSIS